MVVRELITRLGFQLDDGPQKQYDKQIDNTKAKSSGLANAAKGVGIAWKIAAAAVAVGVGWVSKNIIESTVEMEGYRTKMQAFTGSAESAAAALEELRDKTIDPLFGTGNLVNTHNQLRSLGMGATETSRMIDVLGDCANGSAENFNALSGVLTKVSTAGKVNSGTMRQLTMAGFSAQDMAQGLGISVEKLNADVDAGKIGFNELARAMEGASSEGGRFYMNAANQALTLGGSILIIKGAISSIGDAIGTKVSPALANLIGYVTNLIKLGKDGLINFGAKAFDYLIHIIAQVIIFFEVLQMRMKKYGGAFEPLKKIFSDVFGLLRDVLRSAQPLLMNLAQGFFAAFKPIQAFVTPILNALKTVLTSLFKDAGEETKGFADVIQGLTPIFSVLGNIVAFFVEAFGPFIKYILIIIGVIKLWSIVQAILNAIMAINPIFLIIMGVIALIAAIVMLVKKWDKVKEFFIKLWENIKSIFFKAFEFLKNLFFKFHPVGIVIKHWGKIKEFFSNLWKGITQIFTKAWERIKSFFSKVIEFVKKNALNIANVLLAILFLPAGIVMAVVRLIIKHWDTIKTAMVKVFAFVAEKAKTIWEGIINVVKAVVESVKQVWGAITGFFSGLWGGIKGVAGKAWSGIKDVASKAWEGIKGAANKAWGGIKTAANATGNWMKKNWKSVGIGMVNPFAGVFKYLYDNFAGFRNMVNNVMSFIKNLFSKIMAKLPAPVQNVIKGIKKLFQVGFDVVKKIISLFAEFFKTVFKDPVNAIKKLVSGLGDIFMGIFNAIKEKLFALADFFRNVFFGVVEFIKNVWNGITDFFVGLWDGVKNITSSSWEGIKNIFFGVVDGIKATWNGIIGFFAGLWEALKQGPAEALQYIREAFFGLFDGIKEKFFAFINVIKNGWDKVKGFFGNVKDAVVNVVTGGGANVSAASATPVNDMIVTPDGSYSTHPDDFIMAMKNPGDIIEALMRFLDGHQLAYAGAGGGSLSESAMRSAATHNTYHSSSTSNETQVSAPINVNVNASGMSPEMASMAVRRGVEEALSDAIHGSRGAIPSPEARRA